MLEERQAAALRTTAEKRALAAAKKRKGKAGTSAVLGGTLGAAVTDATGRAQIPEGVPRVTQLFASGG